MISFVRDICSRVEQFRKTPACYVERIEKIDCEIFDKTIVVGYALKKKEKKTSNWKYDNNYVLADYYANNYLDYLYTKNIVLSGTHIHLSTYDNYLLNEEEKFYKSNLVFIVKQKERMTSLSEPCLKKLCERALYFLERAEDISKPKYLVVVDFDLTLIKKIINEICSYKIETFFTQALVIKTFPTCIIRVQTLNEMLVPPKHEKIT